MGVTQVEQDGLTSANEGSKTAVDAKPAAHADERSCFLTDILSLPCDPSGQGGLCHTLRVAMAQMQLVTQSIAHSCRHTELCLYNYVRRAPPM